jgi:glutamate transport system permease protein
MSQKRYAEHSVFFDAPGPKTKRIITVVNIVGGAIIAAVLLLVALQLQRMGQLDASMWEPVVQPISWTAYFLPGLRNTVVAAAVAIVGAFVFGLMFGVGRLAHNRPVRWVSGAIVEFCRAVPVLLMMIFLWQLFGHTGFPDPSFWAVVIALILYNGSVCAELVRSGVHNLPTGQHEAAQAIGLTRGQALAQVLVPQALLTMLPALIAQLVVALKDSALGSAIAYSELLRQANLLGTPFNTLQTLAVASVIFIAMNYGLGKFGEWLAHKMRSRGLQLDDDFAEVIPMDVTAAGVQAMLEAPDLLDGHYSESLRFQQEVTGHRRHLYSALASIDGVDRAPHEDEPTPELKGATPDDR